MTTQGCDEEICQQGLDLKQSDLQQICGLSIHSRHRPYRMTNIICTVGPSCDSVSTLCELIEKGMNICRFNLAHADHEYHLTVLHNLTEAISKMKHELHLQVATAAEIRGPGIKIGKFREGTELPLFLKKHEQITLTSDQKFAVHSTKEVVFVPQCFIDKAEVQSEIYIEDGPLCFVVQEKGVDRLVCVVFHEGEVDSHNRCHIPMTLPPVNSETLEQAKQDIDFCVQHKIDMVFVPWVWCPEMVTTVREQLGDASSTTKVIAKIENYEGVKRIDEILKVADGIIIGRGDLGLDIPPEKVFLAQKSIIGRANVAGKPAIVAAQMLDSMVSSPRPTRAEASDIANAILDGADCVMLSKETAVGKFPVKSTETLASICHEAENALYHARMFKELCLATPIPTDNARVASIAAVEAAFRCRASAIVVVTSSGSSAVLIARYRPHCIIIAVTTSLHTAHYLTLYRGIFAVLHAETSCDAWYADIDMRIDYALGIAKEYGYIKAKDIAILVTGYQTGAGSTNTIRSIVVPDEDESPPHYLGISNDCSEPWDD